MKLSFEWFKFNFCLSSWLEIFFFVNSNKFLGVFNGSTIFFRSNSLLSSFFGFAMENNLFLIFSPENQKKGINRKLINLFMMKKKQEISVPFCDGDTETMAVSKRHPTPFFMRQALVCSVRYERRKGPFIRVFVRILFLIASYHLTPVTFYYVFICEEKERERASKWGVGRRKTTWSYHVKYRRISKHVCAHHPIAHLIQWIRCDNDNEKPSPTKRPSKAIFIRLYGFVFVCRFQLNSDWKLTSLHSNPLKLNAIIIMLVSLKSSTWLYHFLARVHEINIFMSYKSSKIISRFAIYNVLAFISKFCSTNERTRDDIFSEWVNLTSDYNMYSSNEVYI